MTKKITYTEYEEKVFNQIEKQIFLEKLEVERKKFAHLFKNKKKKVSKEKIINVKIVYDNEPLEEILLLIKNSLMR